VWKTTGFFRTGVLIGAAGSEERFDLHYFSSGLSMGRPTRGGRDFLLEKSALGLSRFLRLPLDMGRQTCGSLYPAMMNRDVHSLVNSFSVSTVMVTNG